MPSVPRLMPEWAIQQRGEEAVEMFHQPQKCRQLFEMWKPLVDALDQHHDNNVRKFGCFMQTMGELIMISMPMFDSGLHYSKEPIAYCTFLNKTMHSPVYSPNAVFVPVIDPVHGPVARVKAVVLLEAGDMASTVK